MIEVIGYSKYYTRNEDSNHETILDSKFMDPLLWIRVNEHFTPQYYYRKTLKNTKFIKLYIRSTHL